MDEPGLPPPDDSFWDEVDPEEVSEAPRSQPSAYSSASSDVTEDPQDAEDPPNASVEHPADVTDDESEVPGEEGDGEQQDDNAVHGDGDGDGPGEEGDGDGNASSSSSVVLVEPTEVVQPRFAAVNQADEQPATPARVATAPTSTPSAPAAVQPAAPGSPHHASPSPVIRRRRKREPTTATASPEKEIKPDKAADDANACPICMEPWTATGAHQICCLPCGHVFGQSCVNKWLMQERGSRGPCPTCKHPARRREMRLLFGLPTHASAADMAASTKLRAELDRERAALDTLQRKYRAAKRELSAARAELRHAAKRPGVKAFGGGGAAGSGGGGGGSASGAGGGGAFGDARAGQARRLRALLTRRTAGGTACATFEPTASVLFAESERGELFRVRRLFLARGGASTQAARQAAPRRVTAVASCMTHARPDFRHAAVACMDRSVRLLSPDLQECGRLALPAAPLSVAWGGAAYGVLAGLISGEVCLFDARRLAGGPVWRAAVGAVGRWRAVHSLSVADDGAVLAGIPDGVYAARPPRGGGGGSVAFQSAGGGRLGAAVGERIDGLQHSGSFAGVGVLGGGGARAGDECAVVCPAGGGTGGVRMWEFARAADGGLGWREVEVEGDDDGGGGGGDGAEAGAMRGCAGFAMPKTARIDGVPHGTKSLLASFSDSVVRVYAYGRHT